MACPDYYLLASGREFADFANNELSAWLKPRVNHEVYHCIVSAMEHRFRCGNKEGEAETDRAAEKFWLSQTTDSHMKTTRLDRFEAMMALSGILQPVLAMVDAERHWKDKKGKHND